MGIHTSWFLKMAATVRNCVGLTRALARSGSGIRLLAARANKGAVPTTFLRKLTTSSPCKGAAGPTRSEKEINEWVENELSKGWESKGIFYHDRWRDNISYHLYTSSFVLVIVGKALAYARSLPGIGRTGGPEPGPRVQRLH